MDFPSFFVQKKCKQMGNKDLVFVAKRFLLSVNNPGSLLC